MESIGSPRIDIWCGYKPYYPYKETIQYLINSGAHIDKGFFLAKDEDASISKWKKTHKGIKIIKAMIAKNIKEMVWNEISQVLFSMTSSPFSTLDDGLGTFGCYVVQSIMEYMDPDRTSNFSDSEWGMLIDWTNSRKEREKMISISIFFSKEK
jgi:hypothetical protein